MKFHSMTLDGYRRFENKQTIQLNGRLVALLGPNEAGKSSVLKALESLNSNEVISAQGAIQDVTRWRSLPNDHVIISAKYLLEDADKAVVSGTEDVNDLRWLIIEKQIGGKRIPSLSPPPRRPKGLRRKVARHLGELIDENVPAEDDETQNIFSMLKNARSAIDTESDTLDAESIEQLKLAADTIRSLEVVSGASLSTMLDDALKIETSEHPSVAAGRNLLARLPRFVQFSEADRELRSNFDLNAYFGGTNPNQRQPIPKALQNLATTGSLNLRTLFVATSTRDEGKIETLISDANDKIREKISRAWNQAKLTIKLRTNGNILSVVVRSLESDYEVITERSDGLRQFVALLAFLSQEGDRSTEIILLIDEAEIHLHYDAQADLVQTLARQDVTQQVIYTTHSIGCLPEDLGLGIRLVQLETERTSKIVNRFWSQNVPGLSSILIGMGATTMAFVPMRHCILTEGATDMMLLPSIFREAMNLDHLGFQFAPGLSQTSEKQISLLRNEGPNVIYLVDGDGGGRDIRAKLRAAGVPEQKIIQLRTADGAGCVVEDLVNPEVLADALNEELKRSGLSQRIAASELNGVMRASKIESWCKNLDISNPNKADVSYRILEDDRPTLDKERLGDIRALYERIHSALFAKPS